jgi:O-antigen/teichoic acid export membrane protein
MGTGDFGNWMLFLTGYTLLEMLRTGLLQTGMIRYIAGKSEAKKKRWIGTAWLMGLSISLLLCLLNLLIYALLPNLSLSAGYLYLLYGAGPVLLLTFPFQLSQWLLQERQRFGGLLLIKLLVQAGFIGGLLLYPEPLSPVRVLLIFVLSQGLGSLAGILGGAASLKTLAHAGREPFRKLISFGRYSMGTLISANLLRSSDTLLIGAFLGPQAVAIYSLPQKLLEVLEIPLRAVMSTALPSMSFRLERGDSQGMRKEFSYWTGLLSLLMLPVCLLYFVLAEPLVLLLGGPGYEESAWVLRAFVLFACLLPFDRFSGVALDVLNRPQRNLIKVSLMLIVNLVGDVLVLLSGGSVVGVALVSVVTFATGVWLGHRFLRKDLQVSFREMFSLGKKALQSVYVKPKEEAK